MPSRKDPLVNEEYYHIFNKSIEGKPVFDNSFNIELFLDILKYYKSSQTLVSHSKLKDLDSEKLKFLMKEVRNKVYFKVYILAYCLMPNHFHMLLQQKADKGISTFMANSLNSFTRIFNINKQRNGPLFLSKFRSVRITSKEQLIHASRYIHLNPYSSGIINKMADLESYKGSSLFQYRESGEENICDKEILLNMFNKDFNSYKQFVLDNAEHQKTLGNTKYILKWKIKK